LQIKSHDEKRGVKVVMLLKIVIGALFLYAAYCGFLFLMQRQIMFPRSQIGAPLPEAGSISGLEKIWIDSTFGKVETWFIPPADQKKRPAPAVIFGHGNAELIDFWPEELNPFSKLGIGVLLVEYPGYGRSAGHPSQRSITETFIAAYDMLIKREDVDPARIVLFGRSIGGGAVCALASARLSAALILMSTFANMRAFSKDFLVPGFLVRDPFDNLSVVRSYPNPILVIHGKYDDIIPYRHGTNLFEAAQQGKMLSYDCGHNDCLPGRGTFWPDIESFLHKAAILKDS
jgi:pimeloyl-ACP methyl ester carboxylesterase